MTRPLRFALLAALALAPSAALAQPADVSYVVYSRPTPNHPWFNGTRFTAETQAAAEVARLKRDGLEAYYRAERPDGSPAPAGSFRTYYRAGPAYPWVAGRTLPTEAAATAEVEKLKALGYEAMFRADGPAPNPAPNPPTPPTPAPADATFSVFFRSAPSLPWTQGGVYQSRAEADARATELRGAGAEVYIR